MCLTAVLKLNETVFVQPILSGKKAGALSTSKHNGIRPKVAKNLRRSDTEA